MAVKQHCFGYFFSLVFIVKHLQIDVMLSVFLEVSFDYYNECRNPMLFLHSFVCQSLKSFISFSISYIVVHSYTVGVPAYMFMHMGHFRV